MKFEFLDRFSKNSQISDLMKIPSVESELLLACWQTDGWAFFFRNIANAPIKGGLGVA